eukprot:223402_1
MSWRAAKNEFIWEIRSHLFDSLFKSYGYGQNQKIQSTEFIQFDTTWMLEITNGLSQGNIKLICKKLKSFKENISVNYHIEFIQLDSSKYVTKYDSADTFDIDTLDGHQQSAIPIKLPRYCLNDKQNHFAIKCIIEKTMKLEESKNDEFTWHIHGKLWQRFKEQNKYGKKKFISPVFQTSNETKWNIHFTIYTSINKMYIGLIPIQFAAEPNYHTFGVRCMFRCIETGTITEALGVFNQTHPNPNPNSERTNPSFKYKPFEFNQFRNLDRLTIQVTIEFLHNSENSKAIWNINAQLLKQLNYTESRSSPYFMLADAIYYLKCFPKGRGLPEFKDDSYTTFKIQPQFFKPEVALIYLYRAARMLNSSYNASNYCVNHCIWFHVNCDQLSYNCSINYNENYDENMFVSDQSQPELCYILLPKTFQYQQLQNLKSNNVLITCMVYKMSSIRGIKNRLAFTQSECNSKQLECTISLGGEKQVVKGSFNLNGNKMSVVGIQKKWAFTQNECDSKHLEEVIELNGLKWTVKFHGNKIIFELTNYPSSVKSVSIVRAVTKMITAKSCTCNHDNYARCEEKSEYTEYIHPNTNCNTCESFIKYTKNVNSRDIVEIVPKWDSSRGHHGPSDIIEIKCTIQIVKITKTSETDEKLNICQKQQNKEDFKDLSLSWKCSSCTFLNEANATQCLMCSFSYSQKKSDNDITKLNQILSLKDTEIIKLKREIKQLSEQQSNINLILDKAIAKKTDNISLQKQLETNRNLQQKYNELREKYAKLNNEKSLLEDEQKVFEMTIHELREENKQLKMQSLNINKYEEWSSEEIVHWIISLNPQIYGKYEQILTKTLKEEQVTGDCMCDVDVSDIKRWGIVQFKHSKALMKHIEALIANKSEKKMRLLFFFRQMFKLIKDRKIVSMLEM